MKRYLDEQIRKDLARKMVLLGGPRQVGKTTLAKQILGSRDGYLNWDIAADRRRILAEDMPKSSLWVLDELHKYRSWRNFLKGLFDGRKSGQQILVTGSARLDYYRFGGDSLQGRYHYLRLHPLSVAELGIRSQADWAQLMALGGFPEPYLSGSQAEARRWSRGYASRLINDQIAGLERVEDLGNLELLTMRLPELVGSPLSINALREELRLSHATVAKWMEILERMYMLFRLAPFGAPRIRAVKKEQKHYHFDWSVVPNAAARFENVVASHLLKWVHLKQDVEGLDFELRYFRDVDGREVDFVVTDRRKPIMLVEAKWSDDEVGRGLRYLHERFREADAYQISAMGVKDFVSGEGIRFCPALELLRGLA